MFCSEAYQQSYKSRFQQWCSMMIYPNDMHHIISFNTLLSRKTSNYLSSNVKFIGYPSAMQNYFSHLSPTLHRCFVEHYNIFYCQFKKPTKGINLSLQMLQKSNDVNVILLLFTLLSCFSVARSLTWLYDKGEVNREYVLTVINSQLRGYGFFITVGL